MMPEISTNRLAINYDLGVLTLMLVAILALLVAAPAAQAPSRGNSAATIFEGCAHAPLYENVQEFNAKTLQCLQRQGRVGVASR